MAFLRTKDLALKMPVLTNSEDVRVWLKSIIPTHKYVDGKETNEIVGHKYLTRLPHNNNLYLAVKILDGETPLIPIEELERAGEILVSFEKAECKFYTNKKGYPDISVTATDIKRETE